MTTDHRTLAALLRPLRGYAERITARADAEARAAGLTVEVLAGGVRRYRDPRLDHLAAHRAAHPAAVPYADARTGMVHKDSAWSTPTLTASTSTAGAGWSR
jgi:hypothetical protein